MAKNKYSLSKKPTLNIVLLTLFIVGMFISLFLVYEHFSPSASKFCNFGESFDCGIVNKSPYANIDGLSYLLTIDLGFSLPLIDISGINWFFNLLTSNAFLGFLTLLFLFILNTRFNNKKIPFIRYGDSASWTKGILVFGVLYGVYLFAIQHYVLKTYCIFCLALDAVLISSMIIAFRTRK